MRSIRGSNYQLRYAPWYPVVVCTLRRLQNDVFGCFSLEVSQKLIYSGSLRLKIVFFLASYLAWEADFAKVALKHEREAHFETVGAEVVLSRILMFF